MTLRVPLGRPGSAVLDVTVYLAAVALELVVWHGSSRLWNGAQLPWLVVPLITLVVYGVLLVRRARPVVAWGILWLYALAAPLVVVGFGPFAGVLVGVYGVAASRRVRVGGIVALLTAVPFLVDSYLAARLSITVPGPLVVKAALIATVWFAVIAIAWGFGRLSQLLRERAAEQIERALQEARLDVARNLHDSVSNGIAAMMLAASTARSRAELRGLSSVDQLQSIERIGARSMNELRRLLLTLRSVEHPGGPVPLDDLPGLADLADLVDETRSTSGVVVELREDGSRQALEGAVDHAVFRIAQEGLANAVKHGDLRAVITVSLIWGAGGLEVVVENTEAHNGHGLAAVLPRRSTSGLGLVGLRERITLLGGDMTVGRAGGCFTLRALLPAETVRIIDPIEPTAASA